MTTQTKTTYTPGPWSVGFEDLGGEALCYKVYGNDNQKIATVGRWNSVGDEANARLISSAPAILEHLKRLTNVVNNSKVSRADILNISNDAMIIIAKAEGRGE